MSFDIDLDTSSYPCSQIELVDSNHIHMIRIILYVTLVYMDGFNDDNIAILLSNSYHFPMKFVLFSVYFSFHSTAQLYNSIALITCRPMEQ